MGKRPCRQCGAEIVGRDKRAVFCSVACKEQARSDTAKAAVVARRAGRLCLVCGGSLDLLTARAKCCSKACSIKHQNAKKQARVKARTLAEREPCPHCGDAIPDDRRGNAIYCSWSCKQSAISARYRDRNPGYIRFYLYGITQEEYDALLAEQDNKCAICRTDTAGGKGGWHVDHCHESSKVRGLLCHRCNLMLGHAQDDPAKLRDAADYIEARMG